MVAKYHPPQRSGKVSSRALYLRLLGYTRAHMRIFVLAILTMVGFALTEPAVPALLKPLLDGTFVERDPDHLFWMPILIVVLFTVRGVMHFSSRVALSWVASRVVYDLRQQMFDRLMLLPARFYDQNATGRVISRLTYDVNQVMTAATDVLTILVRDSVAVLGLVAYAFWVDWRLSLITFLLGPAIAVTVVILGRRLRALNRRQQANMGDLTHVLEESTRGYRVVKIYQGDAYERTRFFSLANLTRRLFFKIEVASAANAPIVEIFGAIAMAAIIYIGVSQNQADQLSVGEFVSFFGALAMMFSPLKRLTKVNAPLQRGLAAAESVFALIDEEPEADGGNRPLARGEGQLTLRGVSFAYAPEQPPVLHGIDLTLRARETVALVGPSGSGKTTLTTLIPRLYDPSAGAILLDGVDIRDYPLADLRRQIAYVSQEVVLFNGTVRDNIAYGQQPAPPDVDIQAAARAAHAWDFIAALPQGLDTVIGENGLRLSGGQRQRLALARAILKDAPVLLLDEATSALDAESERAVQLALEAQQHQRTTLIIAHRLSTIERADRIVVMEAGRIVEVGRHQDLLAADGLYARLYQTQYRQGEPEPTGLQAD